MTKKKSNKSILDITRDTIQIIDIGSIRISRLRDLDEQGGDLYYIEQESDQGFMVTGHELEDSLITCIDKEFGS